MSDTRLLVVEALSVRYPSRSGDVAVVSDLSFEVARGATLGIVGESGAGKSQAMLALMGLLPDAARVGGSIRFDGVELVGHPRRVARLRGSALAFVFQDPGSALNPYLTIGTQMREMLAVHARLRGAAARKRAIDALAAVQIADPERRLGQYPHELSGGMRQRALIALALLGEPALLIADEPTTALDVTVQAQVLALLDSLRATLGLAIVVVSHDLGVVARLCDRVIVMSAGRALEQGSADAVFHDAAHPYTRSLLRAATRVDAPRDAPDAAAGAPLLDVRALGVRFAQAGGRMLHAVDDVSFTLARGATLGIVGESGSGKSTLARAVARLGPRCTGSMRFDGASIEGLAGGALRALRRHVQIVFQDSRAALDPRMRARAAIEEPLLALRPELSHGARRARVLAIVERVGLTAQLAEHRPGALSGGQCQRIALARALVVEPALLVCDEPLSGLDVSLQAQIGTLLLELKRGFALTLLLIAHDLALVRRLSDHVLVMYLGRVAEYAPCAALYGTPRHPYTQALLASALVPDPRAPRRPAPLPGEQPSPLAPPSGCAFRLRCPRAIERCAQERPALRRVGESLVACHRADDDLDGEGFRSHHAADLGRLRGLT